MGRGSRAQAGRLASRSTPPSALPTAIVPVVFDPLVPPAGPIRFELPPGCAVRSARTGRRRPAVEVAPGKPFEARVVPGPSGEPYLVDHDGVALAVRRIAVGSCPFCTRDGCPHAASARGLVAAGIPERYESGTWRRREGASFLELRGPQRDDRIFSVRLEDDLVWSLTDLSGWSHALRRSREEGCLECSRWFAGSSTTAHCLHGALAGAVGPTLLFDDIERAWQDGLAPIQPGYPARVVHPGEPRLAAEAWSVFDGEIFVDLVYRIGRSALAVLQLLTAPIDRQDGGLRGALARRMPKRPPAPRPLSNGDWETQGQRTERGTRSGLGWRGRLGGQVPVQGEGVVDGHPFYFRARYSGWSFSVSAHRRGDPVATRWGRTPGIEVSGEYGADFEAGYMPLEHAWALARAGIADLRRRSAAPRRAAR